jgi:hypothetical protein
MPSPKKEYKPAPRKGGTRTRRTTWRGRGGTQYAAGQKKKGYVIKTNGLGEMIEAYPSNRP